MAILRAIWRFLIDSLQTLLLAASVFLVIYIFLFRPFQVNGQSMYPNFHNGEYVLTNLIALRLGSPKKGDVVVFQAPVDREKDFIKRVIATTGDTASIQNGSVFVNGQKLDESLYLKDDVKTYGGAFLREGQTITVPDGAYFVMGDNRAFSSDSREWGFIKTSDIIGESLVVYWPVNQFKVVQNPFK